MYHDNLVGLFIFSLGIMTTLVYSKTDSQDVSALNVMFTSMNSPSQLSGWKSSGGDPCGESWKGIKCSGSSVTEIKISGIGVSGSLGYQLSNLKSVKSFDVSSNNLNNQIPYQLPPNVDHLDLSKNSFSGTVPYSISQMSGLKYLNLGHNQLNAQVTDMFQKLTKLEYMDLSHNKLSGDLPSSLKSLSKLKKLFLQDNQLSGSINVLADLPLDELDVQNNKFTGWVPEQLKDIAKTGGNTWSSSPAPPPPPGAKPITRRKSGESSKSSSSSTVINAVIIAASVFGGLAIIAIVVVFIVRRKKKSSLSSFYDEEERGSRRGSFSPFTKRELSNRLRSFKSINYRDNKSLKSSDAVDQIKPLQRAPSISSKDQFSGRIESFRDNEFANLLNAKKSTSVRATSFALSDLQTATANFAGGRLLGQGTIGRVYRAKYPDGKVLAVKKIDSSLFQGEGPGKFSSIVTCISKIRHINIAELVGYCSEQGHHLLIYEYYRNGSLHDFLHMSDDFSKPLTWNTRIRIALGTARAIEYLHEVTSPTLIHKNIKSPNILLDLELNPNLSDYGLSEFYQRTSQNLGVGYNAPECTKPSAYTMKSDVYSFGVVMLELLSGRMPYDSKKPKSEQCLVRWATPQLHDIDALARMVDPALRGLYPPKSLSRFADIIALCVQPEPEFRPPMSEVVEALVRLVQNSSMSMKDDLAASYRSEDDYF